MKTLLRLWPYFKPNLRLTIGAYLCITAQAVFTLLVPSLLGLAVDRGVAKRDVHELALLSGLILLFSALRGISAFGQGYLGESSAQGVSYQMRKSLYSHIQKLSFSFHDQTQTGELMARATSDVEQLRLFTGRGLLMIFNVLLLMVGVAVAMLHSSWLLALLAIAVLPMLVHRTSVFSRRIRPMYRQIQNQIADLATLIQENAAGARVVKAFGRERLECQRFDRENEQLYDRYIRAAREMAFNAPLLDFLSNASTLAMLWVCGFLLIHRLITYGALVAFYAYLLQLVAPIRRGGWLMAMASRAAASAERIFEILDAPVSVDSRPDAIELPPIEGEVEFRDVSCAYHPGRPVLEHVSFVARPGQTIALVGTTG
ncbi:MAG: ABC transporter ATP-binding protein, partial [Chloroflexota bacterium]|nr:ABC transporter ATP-binding protein [Chloroflexota bacterium]